MSDTTITQEIEDQSQWYGARARSNRRYFFILKAVQIIIAAAIPVVALAGSSTSGKWVTAILGALVGIVEGILQLGQFQQNWLLYRATRQALKRESFLYAAQAGPYIGATELEKLYAVRCDAVMSGENSKWLVAQQVPGAQQQQNGKAPQTPN